MQGENTRTHSEYGKVAAPKAQTSVLELALQISSPKPTLTVKKRDLREISEIGFSLLLLVVGTMMMKVTQASVAALSLSHHLGAARSPDSSPAMIFLPVRLVSQYVTGQFSL